MKVLNKFTLQNLKLNKKRTIVTIIGVMLSTALICAVAGMVTSFRQTLINLVIEKQGNYHTTFESVQQDKEKYVINNKNVESYFTTEQIGWAKIKGSTNENKPYIRLLAYDNNALENYAVNVVEGRLPKNENEIIVGNNINTNGRVGIKVGDKITLNVGTRQLKDGTELTQNNPYLTGETDEETNKKLEEQIVNTVSKKYTVVGLMERPSYNVEEYSSPGFTAITNGKNMASVKDISVIYSDASKYGETENEIVGEVYGKNVDKQEVTKTNKDLLRFQGILGESTMTMLYTLGGIVIAIIVVTSVFVIRNSFNISVSEKNRQYGMMSSIGATSKQIKKSVLFEGLMIGLIAVPLGIIVGVVAIICLIAIVNKLLAGMLNGFDFIYSVPLLPILATIVISSITIYLSCLLPAKKASKISPIESIRGNNDIKIKGKKLRTSKLINKLFGIGGVIASKNLKRSRKKYRTTIISIVLSVMIFVSLSSFMEYGEKLTNIYYSEIGFNIALSGGKESIYKKIAKLENVDSYAYSVNIEAGVNKKYVNSNNDEEKNKENEKDDEYSMNLIVIAYNKEYYEEYLKQIGVKPEDVKNSGILIDDTVSKDENGEKVSENTYNIKNGQKFEIKLDDKERVVTNIARTDVRPMGREGDYYSTGMLIVSEEFIDKSQMQGVEMYVQASDADKVENAINDLVQVDTAYKDIKIVNYNTIVEQQNRLYTVIAIFLYGFITVISLIGVTNIFNTITTNMILRSKEFAMLKSIGMTTKEFNRMIRLESILYGLKSLLIGLPLGIVGSYAIYTSFAQELDFGYFLPTKAVILSVIFVFVIIGFTMKYSLEKINKQNIIETIRKDNI